MEECAGTLYKYHAISHNGLEHPCVSGAAEPSATDLFGRLRDDCASWSEEKGDDFIQRT